MILRLKYGGLTGDSTCVKAAWGSNAKIIKFRLRPYGYYSAWVRGRAMAFDSPGGPPSQWGTQTDMDIGFSSRSRRPATLRLFVRGKKRL